MKKWIISVCICAIAIISQGCLNSVENISKNEIQSITIMEPTEQVSDDTKYMCNDVEIESFVDAFNDVQRYQNDVGTTHPVAIDVLFTDGTHMIVSGGSESFATMTRDSQEQQNIQGKKIEQWFLNILNTNPWLKSL